MSYLTCCRSCGQTLRRIINPVPGIPSLEANEDITTAVNFITKERYMDENATKYMQIERNKNWVEKMPQMMKERSISDVMEMIGKMRRDCKFKQIPEFGGAEKYIIGEL